MNEFNPPPKLRDLDAAGRLILVLAAALVLHLALIFGVQVKMATQDGGVRRIMEVRIERVAEEVVAKISTVPPRKIEKNMVVAEATPHHEVAPSKPSDSLASAVTEAPVSSLPTLEMPLIEDPTYYPAKQIDVHPIALNLIKPVYPEKGVELGVDGKVILLLLIDEAGMVKEASVVEVDPEGIFEDSALTAFRNARFAPARKNGRVVKSRVLIKVSYELNERRKPVVVQPPVLTAP